VVYHRGERPEHLRDGGSGLRAAVGAAGERREVAAARAQQRAEEAHCLQLLQRSAVRVRAGREGAEELQRLL
jgi:hypothetical protein